MDTVLFVCSVIACVIGVLTFISGMNARAQNDGVLVQKLEQAIDGLEEVKSDLKAVTSNQHKTDLQLTSHEEQIKTLFSLVKNNDTNTQALVAILSVLNKHLIGGNNGVQAHN